MVFGFFGAGSRSDWHAAGRLIIVPGPALSLSIRPAAKAAEEVPAGGIEAAGVGADCSGMVTDCSGEGTWRDLWRRARASAPGSDHLENLSAGNIILNIFLLFQFLGASACLFLFLLIELLPYTFAGCMHFQDSWSFCMFVLFLRSDVERRIGGDQTASAGSFVTRRS